MRPNVSAAIVAIVLAAAARTVRPAATLTVRIPESVRVAIKRVRTADDVSPIVDRVFAPTYRDVRMDADDFARLECGVVDFRVVADYCDCRASCGGRPSPPRLDATYKLSFRFHRDGSVYFTVAAAGATRLMDAVSGNRFFGMDRGNATGGQCFGPFARPEFVGRDAADLLDERAFMEWTLWEASDESKQTYLWGSDPGPAAADDGPSGCDAARDRVHLYSERQGSLLPPVGGATTRCPEGPADPRFARWTDYDGRSPQNPPAECSCSCSGDPATSDVTDTDVATTTMGPPTTPPREGPDEWQLSKLDALHAIAEESVSEASRAAVAVVFAETPAERLASVGDAITAAMVVAEVGRKSLALLVTVRTLPGLVSLLDNVVRSAGEVAEMAAVVTSETAAELAVDAMLVAASVPPFLSMAYRNPSDDSRDLEDERRLVLERIEMENKERDENDKKMIRGEVVEKERGGAVEEWRLGGINEKGFKEEMRKKTKERFKKKWKENQRRSGEKAQQVRYSKALSEER